MSTQTIAQIIRKAPELIKKHAILINKDGENGIIKYVFKDMSSIQVKWFVVKGV